MNEVKTPEIIAVLGASGFIGQSTVSCLAAQGLPVIAVARSVASTALPLFGEQVVLCGGVSALVKAAYETLVEAGYQPEMAYFECMHELKLIVDLLHEGGLAKMHEFISETAKYGDLTRGPRVVDEHTREKMREVLTDIQDGSFARRWMDEYAGGSADYRAMLERRRAHPIEETGRRLRERMSWLAKRGKAQKAA